MIILAGWKSLKQPRVGISNLNVRPASWDIPSAVACQLKEKLDTSLLKQMNHTQEKPGLCAFD